MRFHIFTAFLLVLSVAASHSSPLNSHARRSLLKRQLLDDLINGALDGLGLGNGDGGGNTSSSTTDTSSSSDPASTDTSSPTSTASDSSVTPAPSSSSDGGLLGGVLGAVSSVVDGVGSGLSSIVSDVLPGPSSSTTSVLDPVSITDSGTPTSTSDSSTITPPPASSSSSDDGGLLGGLTGIVGSVVSDLTSVVGSVLSDVSSVTSQVDSITSQIVNPTPSSDAPISIPPTPPPSSSDPGDIFSTLSSIISSILPPPSSFPPLPSSPTSGPTDSSSAPPDPTDFPSSVPSVIVQPSTSVPESSILPTITFPEPSNTTTVLDIPTDVPVSSLPVSISVSVNPSYSFILTESSLAFASIPTTTPDATLTDPDQATTTVESSPANAATTILVPVLPTGIPNRIYPADQLSPTTDLTGYTLISILFNQELNWPFVVNSQISASQIFAYLPVLISTALDITGDQIKTFALQVYVPTSYQSPSDSADLGTMWLGYIPSDLVDVLAAQIKAKQSKFYTGVPGGVAADLAERVNSGFSLRSVADSGGANNSGSSTSGDAVTGGSSAESKSRQDAIIGVVSALGAIALLVLVFLVYRSMKRRKELVHRRLSDPPAAAEIRPQGTEFDQDSVGGARRRSFYFAEDSLRGYAGERQEEQEFVVTSSSSMAQRRNVVPATISAPILRESSMNW